jgi:trehalose 6-phosphate phosphatase
MKRTLLTHRRPELARFAYSDVLLAFDFDGTLAPIGEDRERVTLRSRTAELLSRVSEVYPCAVISGRSRRDVLARLGATRVKYVVGNHGLEGIVDPTRFRREIESIRPLLERALRELRGVELEDKGMSLAVHYRHAPAPGLACTRIRSLIEELPARLRVVGGKFVVNVLSADAINKGDALKWLMSEEGVSKAMFVGDDATDEDVFAIDRPADLLTVRVGFSADSRASYFLSGQDEVDEMLATLLSLRAGGILPRRVRQGAAQN